MPIDLPRLGLGTWQHSDPEQCVESVSTALEAGYHHVDTAQSYGNEEYVGNGIADAPVDREDVFLATKVATGNLSYDDVHETTRESLDRLGVDVIDLLYIHWPTDAYEPEETLAAFDELVDDGLIDHVGVSNFELRHLAEARELLDAPIVANQIEMHPLLQQERLRADAREHDYWVIAYSPLARGAVLEDTTVLDVAEIEGLTAAQVSLAWLISRENVGAIPKATGADHILENFEAIDATLSSESIERIENITRQHRVVDFAGAPWNR